MSATARRVLLCLVLWAGVVGCAAALFRRPLLLTTVYALGSLAALAGWRAPRDRLVYLGGFLLGPFGEIVAVAAGVWHYSEAAWLIPVWLPPGWGLTALVLLKLAEVAGAGKPRR